MARVRHQAHGGATISVLDDRDVEVRLGDQTALRGWQSFAGGSGGGGPAGRRAWRSASVRHTVVADALCAVVAALVGYLVRFGSPQAAPASESVWAILLLPVVWVVVMLVARSYEERFLWVGPEEFRRVFFAAGMLLATVGTLSWAFRLELARGFVIIALPLATLLTLGQRYIQRQWLHRARNHGKFLQTTLLVGHRGAVAALDEQIDREAYHGYRVIGCCLPADQHRPGVDAFNGLPVLGDLDDVADVVTRFEVDTVAVLPCPELDGPALRRLGWALERTQAELLLAPAVTEVVGTRVQIRPVSGLPLLHMERPELTGVRRLTKSLFDKTAAAFGLFFLL